MALFRKKAETAIPALIAAIYDAALEPAKWQYFVDSLRHELCAVEPAFYTGDAARLPVEILYIGEKWGGVHFDPKDGGKGLAAKLREAPPVGELTRQDLVFSDGSMGDAEFFRNLGAKRVFGVVTHRSRAALSVLQLYYARAMLRRDRRRLRRFVARIVPHISRALQISRRLRHEAGRNATLELTLDRFVSPALLIGGDLRVHYANDAAKAIFCSGALALDNRGRISAGGRARETKKLRAALAKALDSQICECAAPAMKLTRPNDGASSMPLLALFAPCAPAERRPTTCLSAPQLREDGEALMIIADPASKLHLGAGQLSQFFGLTQAEARLANAIAQGTNLKEHAASTHIAVGTARAQLKSVFGKTGTHRQAELAALLARLAPPIQV